MENNDIGKKEVKKGTKKKRMTLNKKQLTVLGAIIILIILIVVVIVIVKNRVNNSGEIHLDTYVNDMGLATGEEEIVDVNPAVLEKKRSGQIETEEAKFISSNGVTRFKIQIKNISSESISNKYLIIKFLDKDKKEIDTMQMVISNLEPGASMITYNNTISDISKAIDYTMTLEDL